MAKITTGDFETLRKFYDYRTAADDLFDYTVDFVRALTS